MSASPLRLLLVEDNPADARLILRELCQAGFDPAATRVDTEAAFVAGLDAVPDIVLCDYSMPQFDALRALHVLRDRHPYIPFIIVSGSIGEEIAVEAIKQGATDYLIKDRLGRLGPAVRQALEDRKLRDAERAGREALRASEEQYRALADAIPQIVWTARPDGGLDYLNRRAFEYTGLAADDLTGWAWERVVHADDLPPTLAAWGEALRTGEPREFEFRLHRADGAYRWHVCRQVATRDERGAVTRWVGTCTDIHDQKAAAERSARDALFLASVRDSIVVTDLAGVVTYWNDGSTRLFGWTAEEMVGRPYANRFPEPVRAWIADEIRERVAGSEWNGEYEDYRKDGSRVWIDARVTPIADAAGRVVGVLGVAHNITARKHAEESLRGERDRFTKLAATAPGVICSFRLRPDGSTCFPYASPGIAAIYGRRPGELAEDATGVFEVMHPDDRERMRVTMAASAEALTPWRDTIRVRRPGGGEIWVEGHSVPTREPDGSTLWHGFLTDITDRRRAEALLGAVMRSVADAIITVDEQGVIESVNPAGERLFGYPSAELVGQKIAVLMPDPHRGRLESYLENYLRTGTSRVIGGGREVTGRRKDATTFPADLSVSEFRLDGTRRFTGVVRDVTARKKLEEQFRQAQKMEAFGQLAGGVAHDFNNLLTVINGYGDLLIPAFPPADPRREMMTAVRDAGERAAGLTAQLLAFSRKTIIEPKVLDLNEVVEGIAKMLRRLIGEDIKLALVLAPALSRMRADLGQVEQVIMNLVVNARDAMPTGGRLSLETADVTLDPEAALRQNTRPGLYVSLTVADTGCGMTDEVKGKIFEPFFTTKGVGRGTGLGLATVYGIVTQADGHVSVSSEVGRGTTFTVLLPAVDVVTPASAGVAEVRPGRGTETVLLVEDEEPVRTLLRIALQGQGYTVLEANCGADAMRVAETHAGEIHLLVTDVVLPNMGGREIAEAVRGRRPGLRVLYVSGYTDDAVLRYGVSAALDAFLQKPFTPLGLARKVRTVLGA